MSEMVERLAKIIRKIADDHTGNFGEYASDWKAFIPDAESILKAMREPTQAMLKAGDETMSNCWNLEAGKVWDSMFYAALTPTAD